jgi:hypothetical protein
MPTFAEAKADQQLPGPFFSWRVKFAVEAQH